MTPITVHLSEDDIVAAQRLYSSSFLTRRQTLIRLGLIWLATTVFIASMVLGTDEWASGNRLLISLAIVAGSSVPIWVVLGFMFVQGPRSARKVYRQQETLRMPIAYSWDDTGLTFTSEFGENRIEWDELHHAVEDEHVILLFEGPRLYRMLPKRVLSAEQLAEVHGQLNANGVTG